jgi:SAM-dependent methyltransferase
LPGPTDPFSDNLEVWERWTEIHLGSEFYDVPSFVDGRNPIRLRDYEIEEVGPVGGRSLLHLQCHFGLDTLSWARLGALATGVDFSPAAIAAARSLADQVGQGTTRFVESNVYSLPGKLDGQFDVVYTSRGVLGWLPDIRRWASVAAHFVKPGGILYLAEGHPISMVFDDEGVAPGELRLRYPYWEHAEPLTFEVKGSYADRDAPTDGLREHGWDHSMGEIVTAVADAGLRIELLHEFDFAEWDMGYTISAEDGKWRLPGEQGRLPLFFSLRARKPL